MLELAFIEVDWSKVLSGLIRAMRVDVVSGMTAGIIVMFGILVVSASTLGTTGGTVNSAEEAARALEPIAGRLASLSSRRGSSVPGSWRSPRSPDRRPTP